MCLIVIYTSIFINYKFSDVSFEQLLYTFIYSEGANYEIVFTAIIFVIVAVVLTLFIFYIFRKIISDIQIIKSIDNKISKFYFVKCIFSILLLVSFMFLSIKISYILLDVDEYLIGQKESSLFIEENYISGRDVKLEFPEKKRNLIYIYAESLESTNLSKENGGIMEKSYMPNLEKLALENLNFSNTSKLGGALSAPGTNLTIAAIVAHTAGIPLKISIDLNSYHGYSSFLPGVYGLGDILEENGYKNYFMIGSKAEFGGRKDYFENHGNYTIFDYNYAIENRMIPANYYVWWGYEDKKLFEFAKAKLVEISTKEEPFNFTLLTADTHFTDGYMDSSCDKVFDSEYANAIYCSDSKINSFVNWIKEQDFYQNTTIIIVGDHLTMQSNFYQKPDNYSRTTYNAFINSPIQPKKSNNRRFTAYDMLPTTLASLGVDIEGDKLGLGVNLFSKEKTLLEEFGYPTLIEELNKKSFFYDNYLLGNTYYEMQKDLN